MKTIFLVWLVFHPVNHTATVHYMGGHEYTSPAPCHAIADLANEVTDITKEEYACSPFTPTHAGMVYTVDVEQMADQPDMFLKVE